MPKVEPLYTHRIPPYQVDFTAASSGKRVSATKRRIRFRFGFSDPSAILQGQTSMACRGEEHEVLLVWSITSGKRLVLNDGREIHFSTRPRDGKFEYSWGMGPHTFQLIAHAAPPLTSKPGFKQFDLLLDGWSFFEFPKIFELGVTAKGGCAASSSPSSEVRGKVRVSERKRYTNYNLDGYRHEEVDSFAYRPGQYEEDASSRLENEYRRDEIANYRAAPRSLEHEVRPREQHEPRPAVNLSSSFDDDRHRPINRTLSGTNLALGNGTSSKANTVEIEVCDLLDSTPLQSDGTIDLLSASQPSLMTSSTQSADIFSASFNDSTYQQQDDSYYQNQAKQAYDSISSDILNAYHHVPHTSVPDDNPVPEPPMAPISSQYPALTIDPNQPHYPLKQIDVAPVNVVSPLTLDNPSPSNFTFEYEKPNQQHFEEEFNKENDGLVTDVSDAMKKLVNLEDINSSAAIDEEIPLTMNPTKGNKSQRSRGLPPTGGTWYSQNSSLGEMHANKTRAPPRETVMRSSPHAFHAAASGAGAMVVYGQQPLMGSPPIVQSMGFGVGAHMQYRHVHQQQMQYQQQQTVFVAHN